MKRFSPLHPITLAFLCILLVAGCATKPVPDPQPTETKPAAENTISPENAAPEAKVDEQATKQEKTPVANLERIHFAFDQSVLSPEARDTLAADANVLKGDQSLRVRIEGYCDSRGSEEYNLALGERRAKAAKDYLVSLGVTPDRLGTISYGEEMPLDPANNVEAWAKNRRADFKILN